MQKPIIRHCRNCKYSKERVFGDIVCTVRYTNIYEERLCALFCRHYKKKESEAE